MGSEWMVGWSMLTARIRGPSWVFYVLTQEKHSRKKDLPTGAEHLFEKYCLPEVREFYRQRLGEREGTPKRNDSYSEKDQLLL